MVGELDAAHVERRRVRGHLVRVVDEDERRLRVDEAPDQPGAGGPVDVAVRDGSPTSSRRLLDQRRQLLDRRRASSRSGGGK